jgi:hypothetical protein
MAKATSQDEGFQESMRGGAESGVPTDAQFRRPSPTLANTGTKSHRSPLPPNRLPSHDFPRRSKVDALAEAKQGIVEKLHQAGLHNHAARLEHCGTEPVFLVCTNCRGVRKVFNHCDRLFCPTCQPRLARKREKQVAWWVQELPRGASHLVLTLANIPDDALTRDYLVWVRDCFGRLRRLKFARKWSGFYTLQITNNGNGFHVHLHVLVGFPFVDIPKIKEEWARLTNGAGQIVKIVPGHPNLLRLVRYVVRPSDLSSWTPARIGAFARAVENIKTFAVFGSLWSLRTKYADWLREVRYLNRNCPCCGCNSLDFYTEARFREKDPLIRPDWMNLPPPPPPPVLTEMEQAGIRWNYLRALKLVPASEVYA